MIVYIKKKKNLWFLIFLSQDSESESSDSESDSDMVPYTPGLLPRGCASASSASRTPNPLPPVRHPDVDETVQGVLHRPQTGLRVLRSAQPVVSHPNYHLLCVVFVIFLLSMLDCDCSSRLTCIIHLRVLQLALFISLDLIYSFRLTCIMTRLMQLTWIWIFSVHCDYSTRLTCTVHPAWLALFISLDLHYTPISLDLHLSSCIFARYSCY
jgi:hypothetical protein